MLGLVRGAVVVEEADCRGISEYGNNPGAIGVADNEAGVWVSRNRLIFSQISWRGGVSSVFGSADLLGVSADYLTLGLAPGVAVAIGVGVAMGVG